MMLKLSKQNQILYVTLNRPEVRNAFNAQLMKELTVAFTNAAADQDLRVVVLSGEGKVFCAGADLQSMQSMVNFTFEENQQDALVLHGLFESIYQCPVPVVCSAHGAAFGGALGLLAVSDVVIAEKGTQFCFSEVKLGLAPAVISDFISRRGLLNSCRPYMLSGKVFSADQALGLGLVHHVTAEAIDRQSVVETWVSAFCEAGPESVRETKKLLNQSLIKLDSSAKAITAKLIAERRISAEGQEGLKSFFEKRTPAWRAKSGDQSEKN
jgi:methylglutaconyl-CoA hydratase